MGYFYAQIDGNGNCISIQETAESVNSPKLILIPSFDGSYLSKRWTGIAWESKTYVPQYRKTLTALEWVETWTADEWRSLKDTAQGTSTVAKRLDQLLDAIRLTGSFNLDSNTANTFYGFLESNGYITAQRRAELTQGILE